jgi:hypothetical protein
MSTPENEGYRLLWLAIKADFMLAADRIERGLTYTNALVRTHYAHRTDFTPTPAQIERGLTDESWDVREAFARRTDYTPTPSQVERGLRDDSLIVRDVFQERETEWRAEWEAQELRGRHASVFAIEPPLEAL